MVNKYLLVILMVCIVASVLYKRWAMSWALRELYAIRQQGDDENFIRALESGFIRMQFGRFTREFMKLNYWVEQDRQEQVRELIPVFGEMKIKPAEEIALCYKLYEYGLKKGRREDVEHYGARLERLQRDVRATTSKRIKGEFINAE